MAQGVTLPAYEHEPAEPAGIGVASPRIDGRAKVTGTARYGSDIRLTSPAHAALRTSSIAVIRPRALCLASWKS
jgi:CO/xanthine dehydrogenase Mo-binding subunit